MLPSALICVPDIAFLVVIMPLLLPVQKQTCHNALVPSSDAHIMCALICVPDIGCSLLRVLMCSLAALQAPTSVDRFQTSKLQPPSLFGVARAQSSQVLFPKVILLRK